MLAGTLRNESTCNHMLPLEPRAARAAHICWPGQRHAVGITMPPTSTLVGTWHTPLHRRSNTIVMPIPSSMCEQLDEHMQAKREHVCAPQTRSDPWSLRHMTLLLKNQAV